MSFSTIYRYIYRHLLPNISSEKNLRRRGKFQRPDKAMYNSVKPDRYIHEWSDVIKKRQRIGDWEGDTVAGKASGPCLVTLADRMSRFLISRKAAKKNSMHVRDIMIQCLEGQPLHSITPDRGKEFARHAEVTDALNNVQFYFPQPHQPWQRGTNENTNGLLREYFPKGSDLSKYSDEQIQNKVDELNKRPRKCLGYRTPYEVYYSTTLHLI